MENDKMVFNLVQFDALMIQLLRANSLQNGLNLITRDMELEFTFQSMGIFLINRKNGTFQLQSSLGLSQDWRDKAEVSFNEPFMNRLNQFGLVESTKPSEIKFEKEYSHLYLVPMHFSEELMGFIFMDREEGQFSKEEAIKLDMFASLASLMAHIFEQREVIENLTHSDTFTGLLNLSSFVEQGRQRLERAKRYEREMTLIVLRIYRYDRIFRTIGNYETKKTILSIADILKRKLRPLEIAGLLYPDTFAFILEDTPSQNSIAIAQRLQEDILKTTEHIRREYLAWGIVAQDPKFRDFEHMLRVGLTNANEATRMVDRNIVSSMD